MDLSVARVAHACRKNRRGRRRIRGDGSATRGVHKGKSGRVEKGCRMGSTGTAKDTTALSAMLEKRKEGFRTRHEGWGRSQRRVMHVHDVFP